MTLLVLAVVLLLPLGWMLCGALFGAGMIGGGWWGMGAGMGWPGLVGLALAILLLAALIAVLVKALAAGRGAQGRS